MKNSNNLYIINSICLLPIIGSLMGAFYFQFVLKENPCPLCLLQRMGMFAVLFGLSLNTFFGFKKEHFGITIIAALIAATFSVRQILLHICPIAGEPTGYGEPFGGMHLYTWAAIIFIACILGSAVFLFFIKEETDKDRKPALFEKAIFYLILLICFANIIASFFECRLGPCCENGPCT